MNHEVALVAYTFDTNDSYILAHNMYVPVPRYFVFIRHIFNNSNVKVTGEETKIYFFTSVNFEI